MTTNLLSGAPAFTTNNTFGAFNIIVKVEPVYLVHGAVLRTITLTPATSGTDGAIDAVWIGPAAKSGDGYDFDGTQVQVKFGGSNSVTLVAGGSDQVSDDISLTIDASRPLLMAFHNSASGSYRQRSGEFSTNGWSKSGADDTSTTDKTGYSASGNFTSLKALNVDMPTGFDFVSRGVRGSQSLGTSVAFSSTLGLPKNRATNDILIGVVTVNSDITPINWPGGWTVIDTSHRSGASTSVAYLFVDGSETAPTVTWTGNASATGMIAEYRGVLSGASAIGNHATNNGNSTTASCNSPVTTSPNSKILALLDGTNSTFNGTNEATGYGVIAAEQNIDLSDADVVAQGGTATNFSLTLSPSQTWTVILVELRSAAAVVTKTFLPFPMVG